jgi:hypothetical protein
MGVAALLNYATTSTQTTTIIEILGNDCEVFLLYRWEDPASLRIRLSPVFTELRKLRRASAG